MYIVDDHNGVRGALVDLVNSAAGLMVVGSAGSAVAAVQEIIELEPLVVVLDGRIGDSDGLDVCRELSERAPGVACVMVTAGVDLPWGPEQAAQAGAGAFLYKQLRNFPLVEVIGSVASGGPFVPALPLAPSSIGNGQVGGANR